jgi:hypothetical protein
VWHQLIHPAHEAAARSALAQPKPAGGAALGQVLIASGAALVLTAGLLVLGIGHRTGRIGLLARLAAWSERGFGRGLPGWAALPSLVSLISLVTALLGMYWDISLHISRGRDVGPLANIAHYPILIGLFGIFTAGVLAVVLPRGERPGAAAVRITRDWYAPAGGVLLAGTGFYALLGFPLDDVWHRIFGQDVTLWGPTHLMLIGGAGLSLVALMVLEREGRGSRDDASGPATPRWIRDARRAAITGGLLIGLSVFQAEYDFGVPQFRLVHQPFLISLAAGCALVVARLWIGRGGALLSVVFYMLVRGGVSLVVAGIIGQLWAAVPLYFAEALCVELAAPALARRPLPFGAVSGVLIGTAGFAAEYGWSHLVMRLPWTGDILPEGIFMAVAGGVAGGLLGALLVLGVQGRLPRPAIARPIFAVSLVVIAAAVTNGLLVTVPSDVRVSVALTDLAGDAGNRSAGARVTISPADAVRTPSWVTITAWQGDGLHVDRLVALGDGSYRTTGRMPLSGEWKTLVRMQDGRSISAVPIYLPDDPAIGARRLPAAERSTRPVQDERRVLQRELKSGVPGWLWTAASLVVLCCTLALVLALGWGVARVSRHLPATGETPS